MAELDRIAVVANIQSAAPMLQDERPFVTRESTGQSQIVHSLVKGALSTRAVLE